MFHIEVMQGNEWVKFTGEPVSYEAALVVKGLPRGSVTRLVRVNDKREG